MHYSSITEAQAACKAEINRCYKVAEEHYGCTFSRVPITFTNKMKKTAGMLMYRRMSKTPTEIRLSNPLLQINGIEFVKWTPGHELAHLIAIELYGDCSHGPKWQSVMKVLGVNSSRTHNMTPAATTKRKTYRYRATCGTVVVISAIRHSKIMRGATYSLTSTNGKILKGGLIESE